MNICPVCHRQNKNKGSHKKCVKLVKRELDELKREKQIKETKPFGKAKKLGVYGYTL